MDEKREFKGIWIPAEIWLKPKLTFVEKLVWAEIDRLSSKEQLCCASNDYFVKLLGVDERRIQRAIHTLKQEGLIKQVAFNGRTRMLVSTLGKKESDLNKDSDKDMIQCSCLCQNGERCKKRARYSVGDISACGQHALRLVQERS